MIPFCILVIQDADDREFMENLFIDYQRLMYSEIYKILQNAWDTEDVLQATLVKLIDKIPELRKKARPKLVNYLITASRNTALNFMRDTKRITPISFEDCTQIADDDADHLMEAQLIAKEQIEALVQKWPLLDERSRYLLEARYILGKNDEELAKDLNIKSGSVRMAMTRARKSAYQLLTAEEAPSN